MTTQELTAKLAREWAASHPRPEWTRPDYWLSTRPTYPDDRAS